MGYDYRRRPINKAVYEIWCNNLINLNERQQKYLIDNKEKVQEGFINLCEKSIFYNYLKASDKKSRS